MTDQGRGVTHRYLNKLEGDKYEVVERGRFGRFISRVVAQGYEQALKAFSIAAGQVVPDLRNKEVTNERSQ